MRVFKSCLPVLAGIGLMLASQPAFAAAAGLPWEQPLAVLQGSLTGPVAIAVSVMAIMIAGATLIFGGEINDFARRMIMIVLVVAVIAGALALFNTLFAAPGASIGLIEPVAVTS